MRVSGGNLQTKYIECIDNIRNIWKVRWDFTKDVDGLSFEEKTFKYKPSLSQIKDLICDYYNKKTDEAILSGFVWNNMSVWLSSENQFNYKAAYDLAVQTKGASLPVKFKFGDSINPIYYSFKNLNEFTDFYVQAMTYINTTLEQGWTKKDQINWNKYDV